MSVHRWPDTLPPPSMPGFALQPVDPSIRTAMEVGAARVRRRTFARFDKVSMEWRMTPAQFAAFRTWFDSLPYSLLGASDDLGIWGLTNNVTRSVGAAISPENLAVDRVLETAVNAAHRIERFDTAFAVDNANLQFSATLRAAGRSLGRLAIVDRNGVQDFSNFDLTAGTLGTQSGLISRSIQSRGNGWYRITIGANLGAGATTPSVSVRLFDDASNITYLGDITKGMDVCETQVRFITGNDLFVPTDTDGTALGASGNAAWFLMPLAMDDGLRTVECRFIGTFKAVATAGLNRIVTAEVEVRYV